MSERGKPSDKPKAQDKQNLSGAKLTESDKQQPENLFEGMTSIRAVIKSIEDGSSDRRIVRILFDESKRRSRSGELSYLKAMSYKLGYELAVVSGDEISSLAIGTTHGGILCEATPRSYPRLSEAAISEQFPDPATQFFAMIEGIEDPYNFGYAIRSLYAAGISALILDERNWLSAAGVVCRASAGASELCRIFIADNIEAADIMHKLGVKVVCCDIKNSVSIYEANLTKPLFLAVGGEKRGLSRGLLDRADAIVRIDYGRDCNVALSAASATAVAAFEVVRQNPGQKVE